MKRFALLATGMALALLPLSAVPVFAADHATPAEARAMLQKAIAHYKSVGRKQALIDFTERKPPFRDRDLYVVCFSQERVVVANGGFPGNVGSSADAVVDLNGKGVGTTAWAATADNGEGTVHYRWVNPVSHSLELKTAFFARVGGDVCGVGAYTPY